MDLSHLSKAEQTALIDFSNYFEAGEHQQALLFAKKALNHFPNSKHIWHNQIGAIIYSIEKDYLQASYHYYQALEAGFDSSICEENIWESAEDLYKSLYTEKGTFNAIINKEENKPINFIRANHLINKYLKYFPNGSFVDQANVLNEKFEQITNR